MDHPWSTQAGNQCEVFYFSMNSKKCETKSWCTMTNKQQSSITCNYPLKSAEVIGNKTVIQDFHSLIYGA